MDSSNQINEQAAIKLLRSLIQQSTHRPPSGTPFKAIDTNLECTVHATVASLAFAICRLKTHVGWGTAYLFTKEKELPQIMDHSFVVRDTDGAIFDSSITIPMGEQETELKINGVGFSGCADCPGLQVQHSRTKGTGSQLEALIEAGNKNPILLYFEGRSDQPHELMERKHLGNYAKWVEQTFGSQRGMWPRFAWVIAQELMADPATGICFDRERLIQKVRDTHPDIVHKVRTICRHLA
jgi:hypothetical protein